MDYKNEMREIYSQSSPSVRKVSDEFYNLRRNLFLDRLKLPSKLFDKARVLEFGAGTGETTFTFIQWGSTVDIVELNPLSVSTLKSFLEERDAKNGLGHIVNGDFEADIPHEKYDIVIAEGCLYLAEDPAKAFGNLVSNLKPGGFVVVAIPETLGSLQYSLRRYILHKYTDGSKQEIVETAKLLFHDSLKRASEAGGRPIDNIVNDNYVSKKARSIPASEVMDFFRDNGITYYSSSPNLFPYQFNDTHYQIPLGLVEPDYKPLLSLPKLFLAKTTTYDAERIPQKCAQLEQLDLLIDKIESSIGERHGLEATIVDIANMQEAIAEILKINLVEAFSPEAGVESATITFLEEVAALLDGMSNGKPMDEMISLSKTFKVLFNGFCGNPSQYYVGYKAL